MLNIYAEDCIDKEKKIPDGSVTLGIFDPPFGLGESGFDKHYKRNSKNVIDGYKEVPEEDYRRWTFDWMLEARRVLAANGSMYVFMGHSQLRCLLNVAHELRFNLVNHIIWKYNFGVYTKNKYVTSHYHVLYFSKSKDRVWNRNCRFGSHERSNNRSLLYQDLEDVFVVNKEYAPNIKKNQNKLPEELIKKLILYSSNEGDVVCDFFMGNFTTAYAALKLGRQICGYELNKKAYDYHVPKLYEIEFGCDLKHIKKIEDLSPVNQGKPVTDEIAKNIVNAYLEMNNCGMKKFEINKELQSRFGRGRFSIQNILEKYLKVSL